ncbi:MraY family glycosyltransferase [Elizabethkingia ursingii]|jgi:UDP-N-acetylmuramyl pentapeptide phosphotransferase/UDP-N-acetylglucosamine-1-phosphate transferase|uniref:UDP-GlcNAc--UDP-phosphate GlcNAc-1-phosphate transferase n=1 Tax=Elizabethkingia ursingii TaxID=1756150 RepID=A0AAJ3NAB2_9FLAO|nr:glycosyltransferase family 4 protein [Elizabethkingia ursingii]AQX08198.1 UDP-GlcNAc--UDP-phosphate GlcNAc-1-phosphate transferase [Elizabethkingia ursingii]MDR2229255.1 glycosyltransferase family 4 protein [Flavobacteriaceae bacterium]OPB73446.1 UDP-GlcNAc--UDP-phosphate GlcNAc-1-phosphate transferase [Elizabethkingia ursingii]OPB86964.1 UDP-GlcNAc--UDP-phosphate GlcNAc-1-phosphate transferase [Elizabethkingia ursingii]
MNYLIVLVLLFIIELIYFKIADKFNIIDKPNERSSHTQITLRGGGIIFYFGALLFFIISDFQYPYFILGLTLMTLVSFLDDIFTLSNKIRLLIHLISVILMFLQIGLFSYVWFIPLIALVLTIGIINAYNFMDGINGITASYSLIVLVLLAIVNQNINFINKDLIYYSIIATLVFGFFNFRQKAKCFAGDVGSVSIAFIIVFLLTQLIVRTENMIYLLFLAVYGLDTIWTIIRRLLKKENIFKAHRSHLYQYLANENKTNKLVVSGTYGLVQLLIGFIIIKAANWPLTYQFILSGAIIGIGSIIYLGLKQKLINTYNL